MNTCMYLVSYNLTNPYFRSAGCIALSSFAGGAIHPALRNYIGDCLSDEFTLDSVVIIVCLQGWVKAVRKQKDLVFVDLNDGSTPQNLQVVAHLEDFPKYTSTMTDAKFHHSPSHCSYPVLLFYIFLVCHCPPIILSPPPPVLYTPYQE